MNQLNFKSGSGRDFIVKNVRLRKTEEKGIYQYHVPVIVHREIQSV